MTGIFKKVVMFFIAALMVLTMMPTAVTQVNATDTSTNLGTFIQDIQINGQEALGTTTPTIDLQADAGYEYYFKFQETANVNHFAPVMTYQFPDGIDFYGAQSGTFSSTATYPGEGTYTLNNNTWSVAKDSNEKWVLTVYFNTADIANWDKIDGAGNVYFDMTLSGVKTKTITNIEWTAGKSTNITYNGKTSDLTVLKTGIFDGNNKINYTITVTSTGHNSNVAVTDTVSGTALSYNPNDNGLYVEGVSGWKDNETAAGFTYHIKNMNDGEISKIHYYVYVDKTKLTGAGTAAETANSATVSSNEKPSSDHNTATINNAGQITWEPSVSKNGTVASDAKSITWTATYQTGSAGGDLSGTKVTDSIRPTSINGVNYYYLQYDTTSPIIAKVYDKNNTQIGDAVSIAWGITDTDAKVADNNHSWTIATLPDALSGGDHYSLEYKTNIVGLITSKNLVNDISINGKTGSAGSDVTPGENDRIAVDKSYIQSDSTSEYTQWRTVITVPNGGVSAAVFTDVFPKTTVSGTSTIYADTLRSDSIEVYELDASNKKTVYPSTGYTIDKSSADQVVITFTNGIANTTGSARKIYIDLKTDNNTNWINDTAADSTHQNNVTFKVNEQDLSDSASVQLKPMSLTKRCVDESGNTITSPTGYLNGIPYYKFEVTFNGVDQNPISIADTFDTSIFRICNIHYDNVNDNNRSLAQIYYGDNDQYNSGHWEFKANPTSGLYVTETASGVNFVSDPAINQNYVLEAAKYYKLTYYLIVKDAATLKTLDRTSVTNGSNNIPAATTYTNSVAIGTVSSNTVNFKYQYDRLIDKTVDESNNPIIHYTIDINKDASDMTDAPGDKLIVQDEFSDTLSIDYSTIKIIDVNNNNTVLTAGVSYNVTGNTATYQVPDAKYIQIKYDARINQSAGSKITISNTAKVLGYSSTKSNENITVNAYASSAGQVYGIQILKTKTGDLNKRVQGAEFQIYQYDSAQQKFVLMGDPTKNLFTTGADGIARVLPQDNVQGFTLVPGTKYMVKESKAAPGYLINDTEYEFTIADTPDYKNKVYLNGDILKIYNDSALKATKTLTGRTWLDTDSFEFDLKKENGTVVDYQLATSTSQTVYFDVDKLVDDNGQSIFNTAGTYNYIICEAAPQKAVQNAEGKYVYNGVTYDSKSAKVAITVDAQKNVTVKYDGTDTSPTFGNTYAPAEVKTTLGLNKVLAGRDWSTTESYQFNIAASDAATRNTDNVVMPASETITANSGNHTAVTSNDITFKKAGTYHFTIAEDVTNKKNDTTYDTKTVNVAVVVSENKSTGVLTVASVKYDGADALPTFTNTNNPYAELAAVKNLSGRNWTGDDHFYFAMAASLANPAGAVMPTTLTAEANSTAKTAVFGKIYFTQAGTYTYTITETVPTDTKGIQYDTKTVTAVVTVTSTANGLTASVAYQNNDNTFNNTYSSTGADVNLAVTKNFTGRNNNQWLSTDAFKFNLTAVNGAKMPQDKTLVTVTDSSVNHTESFGTIHYLPADLNGKASETYTYKITEENSKAAGITYDTKDHYATVTLSDNGQGALSAAVTYDGKANLEVSNVFTGGNLIIEKTIDKDHVTEEDKTHLVFTVAGPNWQNPVTVPYSSFTNGKYSFTNVIPGEYTVTEVNPQIPGYNLTFTTTAGNTKQEVLPDQNGNYVVYSKVESGNDTTVAITDAYALKVGKLILEKTFDKDEITQEDKDNLKFTVEGKNTGYKETFQYNDKRFVNGKLTLENMLPDTYTVHEVNPSIEGYDVTVTAAVNGNDVTYDMAAGIAAALEDGKETTFSIKDSYTENKLVIKKSFAGDTITDDDKKGLSFEITYPDGKTTKTVNYGSDFKNGSYTLEKAPKGEYKIHEVNPLIPGYDTTVTATVDDTKTAYDQTAGVKTTVVDGKTVTVEITDAYTENGSLIIHKSFDGDNITQEDKDNLTFEVTYPDGTKKDIQYSEFTDGRYVLENVTEGEYTVHEVNPAIEGYDFTAVTTVNGAETEKASVEQQKNTTVEIKDTYKNKVGSMIIKKTFTGTAVSDAVKNRIQFKITGPNGYEKNITYAEFTNGEFKLNGLPYGEYKVEETNASITRMYVYIEYYVGNVETESAIISAGDVPVFDITNNMKTTPWTPGEIQKLKETRNYKAPDTGDKTDLPLAAAGMTLGCLVALAVALFKKKKYA